MSTVRIVTDSTADLSPALQERYGVTVVPLSVHFGEEQLWDQVDITSTAFFERLRREDVLPRTSQPPPGRFVDCYREVAAEDPDAAILSLHVSGELSGTLQSAAAAADTVADQGIDVQVIDSRSASLGLGFQVLAAAETARAGASASAVRRRVRQVAGTLSLYFTVDTLEYLKENGRIGRASAFVGTLLNIKPLLTFEGGVVEPVARLRGRRQVHRRLVQLPQDSLNGDGTSGGAGLRAAVVHAAPERADALAAELRERLSRSEVVQTYISPVLGCHAGPGALGVVYHPRLPGQPALGAAAGDPGAAVHGGEGGQS